MRNFPSIKYNMIGNGELRVSLEKKVNILGLNNTVKFLGDLTNREACKTIQRAAVFILPSVIAENGDRDGTPTAITEAMYLKAPVVSSKVSGIPELVDDEVNGTLTEPKNVKQIADALRRLLLNKELRIRMGIEGKKKIEVEFNIEKNTRQLLEHWKNYLNLK